MLWSLVKDTRDLRDKDKDYSSSQYDINKAAQDIAKQSDKK